MNEKTGSDNDAELEQLRQRIDEIDAEIQALIGDRARCAKEVGAAKGLTQTADFYRPER